MDLMKALTSQYMKQELPEVQVGDTVRVHVKIKEGSRERIQIFEGTVIAKKHGGIEETITVRRISYGVGCEKVFPLHAPNVVDVECVRKGQGKGLISIVQKPPLPVGAGGFSFCTASAGKVNLGMIEYEI